MQDMLHDQTLLLKEVQRFCIMADMRQTLPFSNGNGDFGLGRSKNLWRYSGGFMELLGSASLIVAVIAPVWKNPGKHLCFVYVITDHTQW